jgi:hypothetical protein
VFSGLLIVRALSPAASFRAALSFGRDSAAPVVVEANPWLATRAPLPPDIAQIIKTTAKPTTMAGTMIA